MTTAQVYDASIRTTLHSDLLSRIARRETMIEEADQPRRAVARLARTGRTH